MIIPPTFVAVLMIFLVVAALAGWVRGKEGTLGIGLFLSLLSPTWLFVDINGTPVDARSAVAATLMIAFCIHSGKQIRSPLVALDWMVAAMTVWHFCAECSHSGYSVGLAAGAYGEWALPYVAGRFAVMHTGAIARLIPWVLGIVAVLVLPMLYEMISGVNLWEQIFGPVDDLVKRYRGRRWDLIFRAMGNTRHPLFIAAILTLLIPWCLALAATVHNQKRWLGISGACASLLGIIATASRGPLLSLLIATAFGVAIRSRKVAVVLVVLLAILFAGFVWKPDAILGQFDRLTGVDSAKAMEVDGSVELYSSSRNRFWVWRIYGPLVPKGGLFGYGTDAMSTFPPNIPGLPARAETREQFGIVDNSIILTGLRFGIPGSVLLTLLVVAGIWNSITQQRLVQTTLGDLESRYLMYGGCGIVALFIQFNLIFLSYEYAFWLLVHLGVIAGLCSYAKQRMLGN